MIATFWFLVRTSARNRFFSQLRRMRNPRYLVATAAGVLYLWGVLLRPGAHPFGPPDPRVTLVFSTLTCIGMWILAARWWLAAEPSGALAFHPSEVQFLFTGPLSRRDLLTYKLMQGETTIAINAIILGILLHRGVGTSLQRVVSFWIVLSALYLHQLVASLWKVRTYEKKRGRVLPVLFFGGVLVAALLAAASHWPGGEISGTSFDLFFVGIAGDRVIGGLLAPVRLIATPLFTQDSHEWLVAVGVALLVLVLHAVVVLAAEIPFEDAALAATSRRLELIATMRRRRARSAPVPVKGAKLRAPWFSLRPTGAPAMAIVWKNITAITRTLRRTTIIVLLGALLISWKLMPFLVPSSTDPNDFSRYMLGATAATLAFVLVLFGPLFVRNDLRQDLAQLELLRTMPLSGRTIVVAEVASSALVITALQWTLATIAFFTLAVFGDVNAPWSATLGVYAIALVALPVVGAITLILQNAIALLFPGWVRLGTDQPAGIVLAGARMLGMVAQMVTLVLTLVLPAIVALVPWFVLPESSRAAGAAIVAIAALIAEMWWLLGWLGRVFERTDVPNFGPTG